MGVCLAPLKKNLGSKRPDGAQVSKVYIATSWSVPCTGLWCLGGLPPCSVTRTLWSRGLGSCAGGFWCWHGQQALCLLLPFSASCCHPEPEGGSDILSHVICHCHIQGLNSMAAGWSITMEVTLWSTRLGHICQGPRRGIRVYVALQAFKGRR